MENIAHNKLENIASRTNELVGVVNEGVQWVSQHLKDEDKTSTNYKIKYYRRKLKKIEAVITQKPTIALFGASQVGKSYMANNLLYNEDNKLLVYNHQKDELIDFLEHINPEGGGKEATAVITRFTASTESDREKFPVKVKLFNVKDIVCIICDTYNSEFTDKKDLPGKAQIAQRMEEVKNLKTSTRQTVFTDDDIYEIKEYLERYFAKNNAFVTELQTIGFWDFLADNIPYIARKDWTKAVEILWNNHPEISEVFDSVLANLTKLKFENEAYITFDSIVRDSQRSIVNVKTLIEYFFNDDVFFKVQLEDGQVVDIGAGKLCLLTAEITLSVGKGTVDNRPFINNVDIIDFPGARSRFELAELSPENVANMLVRGKVSYLFNHYSVDFKTNTLAYCVKTQKTDVSQMRSLVSQWIDYNLGATPEERTANLACLPASPFFVIFTWWNTQLFAERATNEDPTERIEAQFKTLVGQEITNDKEWATQWKLKNSAPVKFQNYYLLRDFERSGGTFKQNDFIEYTEGLDVENGGKSLYETNTDGTNPFFADEKQLKYHQAYFDKFKAFHTSANGLFEDPEKSFLAASVPGKDGSELIIENLKPVSTNNVSVPIYINVLNNALKEAQEEFNKHHHSDQDDQQVQKAARDGSDIQLKMNIVFGLDAYYFGSFIEHLTISENEILEFYHVLLRSEKTVKKKDYNKYILLRAQSPRLSDKQAYHENLTALKEDYNLGSLTETEKYFKEEESIDLNELFYGDLHNLQNNSVILAEEAGNYWINKKLNLDNFDFFIEKGIEKQQLNKLFDNLRVSFNKLGMTKKIAEEIREFVDVSKKIDRAEGLIAHITAGKINEFVTSAGWSYYPKTEKEKIRKANQENKLNLRIPDEQEVFRSLDRVKEAGSVRMSVEVLMDYMDNLNENLSQKPIDVETLKYVPMIKNYQHWSELMRISFVANCDIPTYDVEANQQLGAILDKIKEYNFSI